MTCISPFEYDMYTMQLAPGLFGTIGDRLNMFELVIRFTKQHFAICHCG